MTTEKKLSPAMRVFILFVDRLVFFVGDHWLLLAILSLAAFDGLPFLAPVLMHLNLTVPGNLIYDVYGFTCHQLAYRTFFFFGPEPVLSLDRLHVLLPNSQDEAALSLFWRDFRGNAQLGYKMAFCERDAAIYSAMLLGSVLFGLVRPRLKPLNGRVYLLLIAPMAVDGLTQLTGLRESDYILRVITGTLFGAASVWLVFPYLQEAMRDVQFQAKTQYERGKMHAAALK